MADRIDQQEAVDVSQFAEAENREVSQNYRIVGKQGSGGCSVVYDAWRISDGVHVAIKVLALPATLEEEEAEMTKRRFYREARILISLKDEHCVKCLEYGVFNGAPCVVLEFVEGQQLDEFLREFGALPFDYGIDIICQVLSALGEAHSYGIIHRDIKPANIMIIQNSEPPVVRLLDFGIATLLEGALGEMMKTKLGVVRGTPSYMAPELFTGQCSASPESDIYAIGLVLLEALTGTISVSGASLVQIAFKQAHEPVEIPILIPDCLAKVIRKCCEKNPEERYHSCEEVIKALQEVKPKALEQRAECESRYLKSIKDHQTTTSGDDEKKSSGSNKTLIILIAALIVVVGVVAVIFASGGKEESNSQNDETIKALNEATEALKAQQKAAEEQQRAAEKAEQEKKIREAEEKAKAAEAAAAKAVADAEAAKAAAEAKAAEDARAAEEAKRAAEEAKREAAARAARAPKKNNQAHQAPAPAEPHKGGGDDFVIPSNLF